MKSPVSVERIRKKIREALKLAGGNPQTESQVHEAVNELLGVRVGLQELRDGMEWNHGESYIRSEWIEEAEKTAWYITRDGIAKENLK
jgi:hypothetical protein